MEDRRKFIFDHASNYSLSPSLYYVNNFGIEVSRKINKIELESGIYKVTRVQDHIYYVPPHINPNINHWFGPVHYYFLNVPINIVYNTKIFYFGGGTYFDYLIGKKETINVNDVILQKSYYCSIASGVNNNSSHNPEGVK